MASELSCSQCRQADRIAIERFGIPGIVLMENAGRSCVEALLEATEAGHCVILCGPGNNGGDGFVIARHLINRGKHVKVLLTAEPTRYAGDAATNLAILKNMQLPLKRVSPEWSDEQFEIELATIDGVATDCVIDALLGTGTSGAPRPPMDRLIAAANRQDVFRVAVDLPSGLDGDTGAIAGEAFSARLTCTFIAPKPGFAKGDRKRVCGEVRVVDISLPQQILQEVSANAK